MNADMFDLAFFMLRVAADSAVKDDPLYGRIYFDQMSLLEAMRGSYAIQARVSEFDDAAMETVMSTAMEASEGISDEPLKRIREISERVGIAVNSKESTLLLRLDDGVYSIHIPNIESVAPNGYYFDVNEKAQLIVEGPLNPSDSQLKKVFGDGARMAGDISRRHFNKLLSTLAGSLGYFKDLENVANQIEMRQTPRVDRDDFEIASVLEENLFVNEDDLQDMEAVAEDIEAVHDLSLSGVTGRFIEEDYNLWYLAIDRLSDRGDYLKEQNDLTLKISRLSPHSSDEQKREIEAWIDEKEEEFGYLESGDAEDLEDKEEDDISPLEAIRALKALDDERKHSILKDIFDSNRLQAIRRTISDSIAALRHGRTMLTQFAESWDELATQGTNLSEDTTDPEKVGKSTDQNTSAQKTQRKKGPMRSRYVGHALPVDNMPFALSRLKLFSGVDLPDEVKDKVEAGSGRNLPKTSDGYTFLLREQIKNYFGGLQSILGIDKLSDSGEVYHLAANDLEAFTIGDIINIVDTLRGVVEEEHRVS